MYNVNPFDLIISEPVMDLNGESIHKVIGFEIEFGEELVLFHGTYGECQNFICSVENNALVKIRHHHKLMDKITELTNELNEKSKLLREYEDAYDRLLADYDEMASHCHTGKISNITLRKIINGKTNIGDALRLLHRSFGMSWDEARAHVNKVMEDNYEEVML